MSEISFQEEQGLAPQISTVPEQPYFIRLVLATGIVSDERQAEYVLIGFVVVGLLAAVFFTFSSAPKAPVQTFKEGQSVLMPPEGSQP